MSAEIPPKQMRVGVPSGYGQTAYRRHLAYRYLGLEPKDVATVTFFRANLRRIARCINLGHSGAPVRPFEYLASTADPEARKVLKAYESVPASYRKLLPPEAFCQAAGVSPWYILEIITAIAVRTGVQASSVLAAAMLRLWYRRS
jgi:hypothetical protein